jgi:DNA-binding response OmpR family regulator
MQKKKRQALIIDDDLDICWMLSEVLKSKDFEVITVNLLQEANDVIREFSPEIIILDNKLPDGLGKEFLPEIRKKCPLSKILFISGLEDVIDQMEGSGIADSLIKPFTLGMFRSSIEKLVQTNI